MPERWGEHWRHGPPSRPPRGFGRRFLLGLLVIVTVTVAVPASVGVFVGSRFPESGPLAAIGVSVAVLAVLLVVIGRMVARSFVAARQLIYATGRLAEGEYSVRVDGGGPRSFSAVNTSFNRMAERLESEDVRRRALLADLGHELRTPLTVLQGRVEALIDGVHTPDEEHLTALLSDVETMKRLLDDLRTLSLSQAGALSLHPEPTDLDAIAADLAHAYGSAELEVMVDGAVGRTVDVDPVRIREVLTNLLDNAATAMSGSGTIRLALAIADGAAVLEVIDDGPGIPASELGAVFDRYQTGDTRVGSGIGLALSRELVEAHGGSIAIESTEGVGTRVGISLPFDQAEAPE